MITINKCKPNLINLLYALPNNENCFGVNTDGDMYFASKDVDRIQHGFFSSGVHYKIAYLDINKENDSIRINIIKPKNQNITTSVYAQFHSRISEILLTKHDSLFDSLSITSSPSKTDDI